MFKLISTTLLTLLSVSAMAWECCEPCNCNRMYVGAFGGGIYSDSTKITQMGTAFFTEAEGGPLAVLADGHLKKTSTGFGGVQIGYEWAKCPSPYDCSAWNLAVAGEVEAFFFSHKKKGHLINPTDRLPEHDFFNSFRMNTGVYLVNGILSINSSNFFGLTPYVGGGVGATRISLHKADSLQVSPLEDGINHFNSRRSDSSWAFAAQAKAGLRYNFCESFHVFAEYRYVYIDSNNYIFGSTVYPTHAPTSPWNVKVKNINYNAFAIGFQYDL